MVAKKKSSKIKDSDILAKLSLITQVFRNGYMGNSRKKITPGQWLSDKMTFWAGSWTFIIGFLVFLVIWMIVNVYGWIGKWDPYPFILLNLVLSCLAAIQAPIILMSQNRAAERDRHKAEMDYMINRKAERENKVIIEDLKLIKRKLKIK